MSLSQLQAATAFLVRFPEKGRGVDWEAFVNRYDLTSDEKVQLHHVAHDKQVVKYGQKLRRFRYVDVAEALPTPEALLGEELFQTLWFDHFEPLAAGVPQEDLAHDFLQFLWENTTARSILAQKAPAHAQDFLEFIYVETALGHRPEAWFKRPLPQDSLLMHGAIYPLALHYDVPKILQKDSSDGYRKAKRAPKPFYYVLLLKDPEASPSLFAIDKSVYDFLKAQLENPAASPSRPVVYGDLVKAGLCRAIS